MLVHYTERLITIFSISVLRYLIFAGVAYLIFYVWKRSDFFSMKIQSKFPGRELILAEIRNSFISLFVFALIGVGIYMLRKNGYTLIYLDFYQYSIAYFVFSVIVLIMIHDTYFYWMHRAIHHKSVYKYVHRVHHVSTNPTPWASFSFHPLEAVLEVGILPIMVFLMPLHPAAIVTWLLFMTLMNVMGHLGFELFWKGFTTGKITKWANTSVHHNMHHKYVNSNFGLYFNLWDRIMGTNHKNYTEEFEAIKSKEESEVNLLLD
jgi:sterol desaturase/sphingolipid hydroxylase (fatty acid hydroxylase superfamily)